MMEKSTARFQWVLVNYTVWHSLHRNIDHQSIQIQISQSTFHDGANLGIKWASVMSPTWVPCRPISELAHTHIVPTLVPPWNVSWDCRKLYFFVWACSSITFVPHHVFGGFPMSESPFILPTNPLAPPETDSAYLTPPVSVISVQHRKRQQLWLGISIINGGNLNKMLQSS